MGIVNAKVRDYVEQKDVASVRTALTTIAYFADQEAFQSFKVSTEYAKERLDDLFQEDDKNPYDTSTTIESYKEIIKLMMTNFSEEKYVSAIRIGTTAFAEKPAEATPASVGSGKGAPVSDSFFTRLIQRPMRLVIAVIILIAVIAAVISLLK
jgi:hypothetical protein